MPMAVKDIPNIMLDKLAYDSINISNSVTFASTGDSNNMMVQSNTLYNVLVFRNPVKLADIHLASSECVKSCAVQTYDFEVAYSDVMVIR